MKVVFAAVLVHALHAALENREVALDRVCVDLADNVLFLAVAHDAVVGELFADVEVMAGLVRREASFLAQVLAKDRGNGRRLEVVDDHRTRLTSLTIDKAKDLHLVVIGALLRLARFAADEGLVRLHDATAATHRSEIAGAHGLTDTMCKEPRALVRDAQHAMKLVRADALLRRAHEVHGL